MLAARLIAVALGFGLAAITAVMIADPARWYATFPGVAGSGPFNAHFVRDLGCAFLVAAGCYLAAAARPAAGTGLIEAATAFLTLHAIVHLFELFGSQHRGAASGLANFAVYAPPLLGGVCLWAARRNALPAQETE